MDVEKYVYVPGPHGNYCIIKVLTEPSVSVSGEVIYKVKNLYQLRRIRGVPAQLKYSYGNDECFDCQGDAAVYAESENIKHIKKLQDIINKKIQYEQLKLDNLSTCKPRVRNINLVK